MSIYFSLHQIILAVIYFTFPLWAIQAATLDFGRAPLCAGKKLLAEDGFYLSQWLGIAKITPAAQIPFVLSYKSTNREKGIFGYGWYSNFLESRVSGDLWYSPWGEVIKLSDNNRRFEKIDRTISGINEYDGWEFLYLFGKLQKITTPEKRIIEFIYEGPDQKISSVNCRGMSFLTFTYTDGVISSVFCGGKIFKLEYSGEKLVKIALANLHPVKFKYSGASGILSQISQGEYVDNLKLSLDGQLLEDGYFSYSVDGNSIAVRDKNNMILDYLYGQSELIVTKNKTCVQKIIFQNTHDRNFPGNILNITGGGQSHTFRYDGKFGRLLEYHDPFGNIVRNKLNGKGLVTETTYCESGGKERILSKIEYNRLKLPETSMNFSRHGALLAQSDFEYDSDGLLKKISMKDKKIYFSYNPFGFIESLGSTPDKKIMERDYNDYNHLSSLISGYLYTYDYNYCGFSKEVVAVNGKDQEVDRVKNYYDLYGHLTMQIGKNNRTTKFKNTPWGAPLEIIDANGGVTRYEYDFAGNCTKVTDPNGNSIRFEYGIWGISKIVTAEKQVTEYSYDSQGRIIEKKNYFSDTPSKIDRRLCYKYDQLGRLCFMDFGNGYTREIVFSPEGHITEIRAVTPEEKMRSEYFYSDGNLIKEVLVAKHNGKVVQTIKEQKFDQYGNRIELKINAGNIHILQNFVYDEQQRLIEIHSGNNIIRYEYKDNRVARQYVNDRQIDFSYDIYGRLLEKNSGAVNLKYIYDVTGVLIGYELNGQKYSYTYDAIGQLLSVRKGKQVIESYSYDKAGNILNLTINGIKKTFFYDKANQLKKIQQLSGVTAFQFDAAGRMQKEGDKHYTYAWNNSVIAIDNVKCSYNPDGQLYSLNDNQYIWDGLNLVHGNGYDYTFEPAVTGGAPVLCNSHFLFTDMLGSTIACENKVTDRSSFGESKIDMKLNFFTGKPLISGLGYNFLLRNYNAGYGRWTSADPLGYPDGWNNFLYVNNRPMNSIDVSGGSFVDFMMQPGLSGSRRIWEINPFYQFFDIHFNRNENLEWTPALQDEEWLKQNGYKKLSQNESIWHNQEENGHRPNNSKWVKGHQEVIYDNVTGKKVLDSLNQGTYNYFRHDHFGGVPHAIVDIFPYLLFGNTPDREDSSQRWQLAFEGGLGRIFDFFDPPQDYYAEATAQQKLKEQRKEDELNSIEIDPSQKTMQVQVWDYAAEDGDRVKIQHFINGTLHWQSGEITIMHTPKIITVQGITEGSQVRVLGTYDGGGGITYAANIGGRQLTNRTQDGVANRYKIKYRMDKMKDLSDIYAW